MDIGMRGFGPRAISGAIVLFVSIIAIGFGVLNWALPAQSAQGSVDLVAIDMESQTILTKKKRVEQGRINTTMIVSADGSKLYVSGVGDTINVYDAATLQHLRKIFVGGDLMSQPQELPGNAAMSEARN